MNDQKMMGITEYVMRKGVCCPRCRSEDIQGNEVDIDEGTASQEMTCSNCGFEWLDVYTLTRYQPQ